MREHFLPIFPIFFLSQNAKISFPHKICVYSNYFVNQISSPARAIRVKATISFSHLRSLEFFVTKIIRTKRTFILGRISYPSHRANVSKTDILGRKDPYLAKPACVCTWGDNGRVSLSRITTKNVRACVYYDLHAHTPATHLVYTRLRYCMVLETAAPSGTFFIRSNPSLILFSTIKTKHR